jgi:carbamoyltransferase
VHAILGISAYYHDSAAALVIDGEVVAAAQEERFSRIRHDASLPVHAIESCLTQAGISARQLDWVAFYEKPLRHFDRILETQLAFAPRGYGAFRRALPLWLEQKFFIPRSIRRALGTDVKLVFTEHHEAHAASAFFPSPFERAAILTSDGVGEWCTTSWGTGQGSSLRLLQQMSFPHSLGLLYSAFTYFCGFKVNSGEYKLMGLAPYGEPRYAERIRQHLVRVASDGSFQLSMEYFTFGHGLTMTGRRFSALFDGPPRSPEAPITQREMDLAASIQRVTEDILLAMARHVHARTGLQELVLAGGVALNCVANERILRDGPFRRLWIQPAAGDAGGALGAALFTYHQLLRRPRVVQSNDGQKGSLLGPAYETLEVCAALDRLGARYRTMHDDAALLRETVTMLAQGKVVGWFQGRMEFGPRALGSRSILGDPRVADMQSTMNLKIKYRESFRPFAPCVLRERAQDIFVLPDGVESPYMLLVAKLRPQLMRQLDASDLEAMRDPDLCKRANVVRSTLPAITHVDGSARLQTVDAQRHGRFYRLMVAFEQATGCPVLVNTSFNVRGEPIVSTPEQAYACFIHTEMDALVIGDCVLVREDQATTTEQERRRHLARFGKD